MYSYTIFTDDNGLQRVRWLKREFVPKTLQKRYSVINPNGKKLWALAPYNTNRGPNCRVVILMCFFNGVARDTLRQWVDAGIKVWHDSLGERRGVEFRYTKYLLCFKSYDETSGRWIPNPDFGEDVVIIRENINMDVNVNIGYKNAPSVNLNTDFDLSLYHFLNFDVKRFSGGKEVTIRDMVHELGELLKATVDSLILFFCQNLGL
jgi:hypothetical protein